MAGAALLMATSAIGPGFLTQTAVFTSALRADFAFAILASIAVDVAAQVNVWRVLGVARRRGQELASDLVPGLGTAVALLVAFGGLVFNVGNIAGCGLGLAVLGVPAPVGAAVSAAAAVALLSLPRAARAMDLFATLLGGVMIVLTAAVMVSSGPDYGAAARGAVAPGRVELLPLVTLVGGTVGGYITFSGVHRLLDAGVGGPGRRPPPDPGRGAGDRRDGRDACASVPGRPGRGGPRGQLDPGQPRGRRLPPGAGEWGYRVFGVVLWSAAITSVVGCSYTSLSFLRTLWDPLQRHLRVALAVFIGTALVIYLFLGRPVPLLVLAGGLNGLILPVTLGVVLLASRRRDLMGEYRHPAALQAAGWMAWLVSVGAGALAVGEMGRLWTAR